MKGTSEGFLSKATLQGALHPELAVKLRVCLHSTQTPEPERGHEPYLSAELRDFSDLQQLCYVGVPPAEGCGGEGALVEEGTPEFVCPDPALEAAVLQLVGVGVKHWQLHTALAQQCAVISTICIQNPQLWYVDSTFHSSRSIRIVPHELGSSLRPSQCCCSV